MGDRVPVFISFLAGASHSTTNAPLAGKLAEGRVPTAAAPGIMWPMAVSNTPFPESHPPRSRAHVWLRRGLIAIGALTLFVGSAVGVGALWAFMILPRSLPSVTELETLQPVQGSKIYDDNDEPMTELHVEHRIFVPLAQIPQVLRDAIIATEDRRFYSHWGVDPIGIARAVVQNYRRGRIVEGGSTITQQLAKVLFLTAEEHLRELLRDGAAALDDPAAPVVLDDRAGDPDRVHAPVRVESPVLRRDDRIAEGRGNLGERNE